MVKIIHIIPLFFLLVIFSSLFFLAFSRESITYEMYKKSGGISNIKLSDGFTNYELTGPSDAQHTVVLIHGGTIPLCIWNPQMSSLQNAGFRVLRYDQYGKGFSDRPHTKYNRTLYVRQLKELLDSLGITEPVDLIGPSFGGAISVTFASLYPERVKSLLLISPALNVINSDSPLSGPLKLMRNRLIGSFMYKAIIKKKLIDRAKSIVPGGVQSTCYNDFTGQFKCKGTDRALLSMFKNDAFEDYHQETIAAGKNCKKVLLLRGKADKEITQTMIQLVHSEIPQCKFIELDNSGHSPGTSSADILNKIIVDFISE